MHNRISKLIVSNQLENLDAKAILPSDKSKTPGHTQRRLFHYTRSGHMRQILAEGQIRVATMYVDPTEKPVVWFSYRPEWEPSATPLYVDKATGARSIITFEEFRTRETPYRIEVNPQAAPLDWRAWRQLSGVKPGLAKCLKNLALRQHSNVKSWRMSFEPVTRENWLAIELYENGQWRSMGDVMKTLASS